MIPLKITKAMLPNLPDEIFEMFVEPLSDCPPNKFDNHPKGRWFCHFGGLSIEEFSNLKWQRSILFIKRDDFHKDSLNDIMILLKKCSERSREHLLQLKQSIENTGKLPEPIVCIKTSEGFRVLDGIHRLAAVLSLNICNSIPLDAWIGE